MKIRSLVLLCFFFIVCSGFSVYGMVDMNHAYFEEGEMASVNSSIHSDMDMAQVGNVSSFLSMAGETCPYGYDGTDPQDRYSGAKNYNFLCPIGSFVCKYTMCFAVACPRYVEFQCCDQNGVPGGVSLFGDKSLPVSTCYNADSIGSGFYRYYNVYSLQGKYGGNGIQPYGTSTWSFQAGYINSYQSCLGSERIVGFHGYFIECIDQSVIYCRKTCNCPPGQYRQDGDCVNCFAGTYSLAGAVDYRGCIYCSAGSYSSFQGATTCQTCSPGSYNKNVAYFECQVCSSGSYAATSGASTCQICEPGSYSAALGATACQICPLGLYSATQGSSSCTLCAQGTFSSALGASTGCLQCVVGSYSTGAGGYACISCPGGTYSTNILSSSCSACIPGNYAGVGSSTCTSCSAGRYSTVPGASSVGSCTQCATDTCLSPGQYSTCGNGTKGDCGQCQATLRTSTSYYIVSRITGYALNCPMKNTSSKGSYRNCTDPRIPMQIFYMTFKTSFLDLGSFCMFQGNRNNQPYFLCSALDFSPYYVWWQGTQWMGSAVLGDLNNAVTGPSVDGNQYLSGEYQPMTTLYLELLDNSAAWEILCSPGTYASAEGSTACTLASAGYYASSSGSTSQSQCSSGLFSYTGASACASTCPAGSYKAASGSQCLVTNPGSYSTAGISIQCPKGTFSSMEGVTVCTNCLAGTYSSGTGMDSFASCTLCAQGSYASSAALPNCTACSAGRYNSAVGSTTCLICTSACPAGRQLQGICTPTSDTYCTPCTLVANCFYIAGTPCGNATNPNCLCTPGFELIGGQCQQCKAGFFKSTNSSLPCAPWNTSLVCSQGYFSSNGTRFANAACLPSCPIPPGNATVKGMGCQWGCNAGFNNTMP